MRAEQAFGATSVLEVQFYKTSLETPQSQRCTSWAGMIFWANLVTFNNFAFSMKQATFTLDIVKFFIK